jgi:hypothetical protein
MDEDILIELAAACVDRVAVDERSEEDNDLSDRKPSMGLKKENRNEIEMMVVALACSSLTGSGLGRRGSKIQVWNFRRFESCLGCDGEHHPGLMG